MKHIKKPFVSYFSKKAGQGKSYLSSDKPVLQNPLEEICKHNDYCGVRRLKQKERCYLHDIKTCETHKFYSKFGKDYLKQFKK